MSKSCIILGSGFGLYGYLPAAVRNGYTVILPERYREKFNTRTELASYSDRVDLYEGSDEGILNTCKADLCIIARRPSDQHRLFVGKKIMSGCRRIVLEKPLAATPAESARIYRILEESAENDNISYRIGYTFLYTVWGKEVIRALQSGKSCRIYWSFMAHHFIHAVNTWKRYLSQGGGALRFYGIQTAGLLAAVSGWDVISSILEFVDEDEPARWRCTLSHDFVIVDIKLDCMNKAQEFSCTIEEGGSMVYQLAASDPFETNISDDIDRRAVILEKIIASFDVASDDTRWLQIIGESVRLWEKIEQRTIIEKTGSLKSTEWTVKER